MRFLLPHERWVVGWMLAKQRTRKNAAVVDMEQKYGPRGMVWMDAYFANLLFVPIPAVASVIPVMADQTRTSRIALYLLAVALLFLTLGVVRVLQASHAGRRFRRERQ